ncbi:phospholipase D family protein [Chromobacterium vaccinii]|uniref:phospholipase D family nuclease n=1 Tax=Chromobacterium vaccinii TaxID=1108595 RepID=UPI003459206A
MSWPQKIIIGLALTSGVWLVLPASAIPFSLNGAKVEAGFSPNGSGLALVLKVINSAQHSIDMAAYSLTSRPVAEALVTAAHRGVQVRVVADSGEVRKSHSVAQFLANQRVSVRTNDKYLSMHDKYLLVDGNHLQQGSFNYSAAAASRNAENVVVTWNAPQLVKIFQEDWQRLWSEGTPLPAQY